MTVSPWGTGTGVSVKCPPQAHEFENFVFSSCCSLGEVVEYLRNEMQLQKGTHGEVNFMADSQTFLLDHASSPSSVSQSTKT